MGVDHRLDDRQNQSDPGGPTPGPDTRARPRLARPREAVERLEHVIRSASGMPGPSSSISTATASAVALTHTAARPPYLSALSIRLAKARRRLCGRPCSSSGRAPSKLTVACALPNTVRTVSKASGGGGS